MKVRVLAVAFVLCFALAGCGSSSSSSPSSSSANVSSSSTQSSVSSSSSASPAITDEVREACLAYVTSEEYTALNETAMTVMNGAGELVEAGNSDELLARFTKLSAQIQALEAVDVPDLCADINSNLLQFARAEAVTLGDMVDAADAKRTGNANAYAKAYEEAGEYAELAKGFLDDYNSSVDELMAKFK